MLEPLGITLQRLRQKQPDKVRDLMREYPPREDEPLKDWLERVYDMDAGAGAYLEAYIAGKNVDGADPTEEEREYQRRQAGGLTRQEINALDKVDYNFRSYGVVPGDQTFDNFNVTSEALSVPYYEVGAFLRHLGAPIITLAGPTGTGKTHLLRAAARYLEGRGDDLIYIHESDLIGWGFDAARSHHLEDYVTEITGAPWLFIDELGLNKPNNFSGQFMDRILTLRHEMAGAKRTMITTNLRERDLPPRIVSRLLDLKTSKMINFSDIPDYRRQQPTGGLKAVPTSGTG